MRETVYRGRIVTLEVLDGRWEVVRHDDSVCVLVARGDQVLGVRQWRVAVGADTWELPAGLIDRGETPLDAARRELAEEAGVTGDLTYVTSCFLSPGFTDERTHLFSCQAVREMRLPADDDEELVVEWRGAREAWDSFASGTESTSASTMVGLAYLLGRLGELP